MRFIIFIALRILDLISTYLCLNIGSIEVEANPIAEMMIGTLNDYWLYSIINMMMSLSILLLLETHKDKMVINTAYNMFLIVNGIVVLLNFMTYGYVTIAL